MRRWIIEPEVERLQIPGDTEDGWVEIKKHLDVGDQDDLKSKLIEIEKVIQDDDERPMNRAQRRANGRSKSQVPTQDPQPMKARFRPSTVAMLVIAIKDWSFQDSSGHKIPVTEPNIRKLDPWLANWLYEEIGDRNPLSPPTPMIMEASSEVVQ